VTSTASHPYITFDFSTKSISSSTWFSLGEALSKCQHLAGVPLKPESAQKLYAVYLARGVQATTAIEGNTLSDVEVQKIVNEGSADVAESRVYLEREVKNVLGAVREIDAAIREHIRLPITIDRLCDLNFKVLDGIPDKPEVVPGKIRSHDVMAGPYRPPSWPDMAKLTEQLVKWLAELRGRVSSASRPDDRFTNAVLTAILAHLYVAWIHPFGNGNGRVARLIEVQILSESGLVPLVATNLLSDHYNKTRAAYYLALDAAQKDVHEFVSYAVRGFVDELRDQIAVVRDESLQIHWESYVYEVFRNKPNTTARDRQREVALTMPAGHDVTPEQVTDLSPSLARLYALCGPRTPARDMNDLHKMNLVSKPKTRTFRVNREIIEAFIPPVAAD